MSFYKVPLFASILLFSISASGILAIFYPNPISYEVGLACIGVAVVSFLFCVLFVAISIGGEQQLFEIVIDQSPNLENVQPIVRIINPQNLAISSEANSPRTVIDTKGVTPPFDSPILNKDKSNQSSSNQSSTSNQSSYTSFSSTPPSLREASAILAHIIPEGTKPKHINNHVREAFADTFGISIPTDPDADYMVANSSLKYDDPRHPKYPKDEVKKGGLKEGEAPSDEVKKGGLKGGVAPFGGLKGSFEEAKKGGLKGGEAPFNEVPVAPLSDILPGMIVISQYL